MWDFVKFSPEKKMLDGMEFIDVNKLPKNAFASESDAGKARGIIKRAKYFHFQNYEAEEGLVRQMKEHGCVLVIGVSDFFGVDEGEMARRVRRAGKLVEIANKYGVEIRICTLARGEMELRDEYELYWIGKLLGMEEEKLRRMRGKRSDV
ncbi:MAG: hypothetical protein ABIH83_02760 [Candidatus Micrarchaeota archaeon]